MGTKTGCQTFCAHVCLRPCTQTRPTIFLTSAVFFAAGLRYCRSQHSASFCQKAICTSFICSEITPRVHLLLCLSMLSLTKLSMPAWARPSKSLATSYNRTIYNKSLISPTMQNEQRLWQRVFSIVFCVMLFVAGCGFGALSIVTYLGSAQRIVFGDAYSPSIHPSSHCSSTEDEAPKTPVPNCKCFTHNRHHRQTPVVGSPVVSPAPNPTPQTNAGLHYTTRRRA